MASSRSLALPLVQIDANTYKTEHCLFVIDGTVTWSAPATAYNDLYAPGTDSTNYFPKLHGYFDTLTNLFPGNYFSVCYIANTGASNVPNYIDRAYKATGISSGAGSAGIGSGATPGTYDAVDMCRYNLPGGNIVSPALAVFDHEIGHAWGAQIFYTLNQPSLANGHWLPNSTVDCQLGGGNSTDGYITVNKIYGDPVNGFRWQKVDNARSNETQVFSEQTLYLMGVSPTFTTSYVLNAPVYNSDGTMGYSSVDTFDHAAAVSTYGARNPSYATAPKQFKLGFVYVARDLAEVNTVYQVIEQSIASFCNDDTMSTSTYRGQASFLCNTRYRASVDGLLADLDGNATPAISVTNTYVTSSDGSASVAFASSDPDGSAPAVAIVPASSHASVSGNHVNISGLPDGVHFFTLEASDTGGKKAFGHFVVEVTRPSSSTTITAQPIGQTVTSGNNAVFTATATGTPSSLTYQWYRQAAKTSTWNALGNGGSYSGATTATLTVGSSVAMDGDRFLCFVSNSTGAATSAAAALAVNETVPVITSQPVDKFVTANTNTFFRVAVGGVNTYGYYYYQWQRLPAGSATWSDIAASSAYNQPTTSQLTIVGSTVAMDGDQFRCVVTNTAGPTISSPATLAVGTAPQITTQPIAITSTVEETISFTVVASGTAPLTYQWMKFGTVVGSAATLTLTNIQTSDAGTYGVFVTNSFGLAYSNNVGLTVNAAVGTAPVISTQPVAQTVTAGGSASFSVAASGTPSPSYQWYKDGVAINGATGATLALANVLSTTGGAYTVVVTNSAGSATSADATLTVALPVNAPVITTAPQSASLNAGQSVTFSVTASGTSPFTYQWAKDGAAIGGATLATLSLSSVQPSASGDYTVTVSNSAGSVTSTAGHLTVAPQLTPPTIVLHPASLTLAAGATASFSVTANLATAFAWKFNGAVLAGETSSTLTIPNVHASNAGTYSVVVSNDAGAVTSGDATLAISAVDWTGSYFGFFGPEHQSGEFALLVKRDGTASLVARPAGSTKPVVAESVALHADGSFTFGSAFTDIIATATHGNRFFTGSGSGQLNGTSLALSIPSLGLTGTTTRSNAGAGLSDLAGLYQALPLGESAGEIYVLIGEGGETFLLALDASGVRAGTGTTNGAGAWQVTLESTTYAGTVNGGRLAGTATAGGSVIPLLPAPSVVGKQRLINISSRGLVGIADKTMIAGFVITGTEPKDVLVRAIGPTLATLGVAGVVSDPRLKIIHEAVTLLENDDWNSAPSDIAATTARLGGFPLPFGSRDAAILAHLSPGLYSAQVIPGTGSQGVAIVEVYDAGRTDSTAPKVVNISTRAEVGRGDDILIAGFVITGDAPKQVLLRALGPTLTGYGVSGALADPLLKLFKGAALIKENDNWGSGADAALIATTAATVGAAPLPPDSKDASLLLYLEPGVYGVHVRGVADATGIALVEVYEVTD